MIFFYLKWLAVHFMYRIIQEQVEWVRAIMLILPTGQAVVWTLRTDPEPYIWETKQEIPF